MTQIFKRRLKISIHQRIFLKKICKRNLVGELKKLIEANIAVLNYIKRLIFDYSFG